MHSLCQKIGEGPLLKVLQKFSLHKESLDFPLIFYEEL